MCNLFLVFRYFSWLPFHSPMSVVFGEPIEVIKNSNPTQQEIDKMYEKYITAQKDIFNQYKERYGYDKEETFTVKEVDENRNKNQKKEQ